MSILGFILGRRLANREQAARKIGAFEGVPAMWLDGLGSSSYGPEAALTMLIPLGAAGLVYFSPIILIIVALLAILYVSYWQTIRAYPNNGGSYVVCRENFGAPASLLAASALMIDYVLNVAVGISAGIAALVSAVPELHPYTLALCLVVLGLTTVANLRGTVDKRRWVMAFVFGLVHGFGFASVLADLGLPQGALALALVGFNVGVELGQLAIVAAFLPLAYALRTTGFYRVGVLRFGSLLVALLAGWWFVQRAFDLAPS